MSIAVPALPRIRRPLRDPRPVGSRTGWAEGYVAIDALVALSILSTAVMLTLGLSASTRQVASAAWEERRAEIILRSLLEVSPLELGSWTGRAGAFDWSVTSLAVDGYAVQPATVPCRRAATLRGRETRRGYALETVKICQRDLTP